VTSAAVPNTQAIASSPQSEELLVRADRAAIHASLARGVAHDLRGPLQTLTLLVDPHADFFGGPEGARLWGAVAQAVQNLNDTIESFGRIYAHADSEPVPVVIDDLLSYVAELQGYQRGLSVVGVELRIPGGLPPLRAVELHLRHQLLSLITNAKLALDGQEGGRIVLAASCEGGEVRLMVEDNGPGVAAVDRMRVFEPFWTTRPGALGLGLPVARLLAQRQGGSLTLEGAESGGTRAVLTLPSWRRSE